MLTMCKALDESIICCGTEQAMNSGECSEIVFNNATTMMDSSSMMANTLQMTTQPSINMVNHSIYYYFSTTFEVSVLDHCIKLKLYCLISY